MKLKTTIEAFAGRASARQCRVKTRPTRFILAGFTLLPVMLAMSLIATIAFLLNRDNGMNINMIAQQMDTDRARYAAEAGLQAANARVQSFGCTGGFPTSASPVINSNFGGGSYTAYATSASGNTTSLVSTGTVNGTAVTLTRNNIYVYQSATQTYTLQPGAAAGMDTYIDSTVESNYGTTNALSIKKNQQNLLFKFDLSTFPTGSRPVSATFSIYGSGGLLGGVELYRMTSDWVEGTGASSPLDGATWQTKNGSTAWITPGGDFYPVKLDAQLNGGSSWADFNATDIISAWLSGLYPNHGVIVKSTGELGSFKYTSSDSSDATHWPKIEFNYMLPCGTVGPSDSYTLTPVADSFDDSSAVQTNNGASTTLKIYKNASSETRTLLQFDTSSLPAGRVIKTATLRLYVNNVGSLSSFSKPLWVNAISDVWEEGAGNNTLKLLCPLIPSVGSSWNYSNNCTNWSTIHPPNMPQSWTAMASMPTSRVGYVVATVNNKIYVIGGTNGTASLKTVEEYDPATNTWATKANMTTARAYAAAAVVNGKIYVMGGTTNISSPSALKTNEAYDPSTNSWSSKAQMTTARMYLAAVANSANNRIYAIGGATTSSLSNKNEEYNPSANSWAGKSNLPTARAYLSTLEVNGKIYAMGGLSGLLSLSTNEMFDSSTNSWSTKASLPDATDSMASAVIDKKIYLISGYQTILLTKKVWMYDTLNNVFVAQTNYPIASNQPAAATVNGTIYSMGGDDAGSTFYQNQYKFDPGIPTPIATAKDETTSASPLAAGFTGGWITFDLKTLVQEWVDGVRPNNGLVITTEVPDQFNINSKENSTQVSGKPTKPQLLITY